MHVCECEEAQICIPNRAYDKGAYLQICTYAALEPSQKKKWKKRQENNR